MPRLLDTDLTRMRQALFFEGDDAPHKFSRFWLLLILSGIIASAGVVSDSTATVIGAMIVAPLMTPILGLALSLRLGDGVNVRRSLLLTVIGGATVVAIGALFGFAIRWNVVASSNAQVAARVSPHLVDLLAALATGAVGAVALARSDISDTLPGVAIAISLVPPLSVVGLTFASGAYHESLGALVLFTTNVVAILVSGSVVFALYRIRREQVPNLPSPSPWRRWRGSLAVGAVLLLVSIPLTRTTIAISTSTVAIQEVSKVARPWASDAGAVVASVDDHDGVVYVYVIGPTPGPSVAAFTEDLHAAGLSTLTVKVGFVVEQTTLVPAT